ncbi:class I SAM-dependent methyltransferase [Nocardioides speluncae]|uniref:class I SAM-dependent methyltransferase n=1 Tax=Nocardioides speluncae TaxID=2670337 RepID=UPI000D698639|nr:class I SAM-dependent methyltransferase [Nocardioides speluncae]
MTVLPFSAVWSSALRGEPCTVWGLHALPELVPLPHWHGHPVAADEALLGHCVGATIDIGCGPGRLTAHLAREGHTVLGIDVVPEAVRQTQARGGPAIVRSVFEALPGEGRWQTALLADGNIGIGGDPAVLLRRTRTLLAPGGRVVADLAPPGTGVQSQPLRIETATGLSRPFQWALVGADAAAAVAREAGLSVELLEQYDDRWFAVLGRGT